MLLHLFINLHYGIDTESCDIGIESFFNKNLNL